MEDVDIAYGEKVVLKGRNGCGKSSIVKAILEAAQMDNTKSLVVSGNLWN